MNLRHWLYLLWLPIVGCQLEKPNGLYPVEYYKHRPEQPGPVTDWRTLPRTDYHALFAEMEAPVSKRKGSGSLTARSKTKDYMNVRTSRRAMGHGYGTSAASRKAPASKVYRAPFPRSN